MKLNIKTNTCLICQRNRENDLVDMIYNHILCFECLQKIKMKQNGLNENWTILYEYNDFFQSLLYQYKGKGRDELASIFLYGQKTWLINKFKDYEIVLVPSSQKHVASRGFDHLELIMKDLQLPIHKAFYKCVNYQQSMSKNRQLIRKYLHLNEEVNLKGKRILLVDDVITSGNTLKRCLELLKRLDLKAIHVLVLASKGTIKI